MTKLKNLRESHVESHVADNVNFKLTLKNNVNLKTSIQNSTISERELFNNLDNLQGDTFGNPGIPFNKIVLQCLGYFFTEIYQDRIQDNIYTLDFVKGCLDNCNHSPYTPLQAIPGEVLDLRNAPFFNHVYCIIQLAHYLNELDLEQHQFFIYSHHFITTGLKLPESEYKHDLNYLNKKYNDYATATEKGFKITSKSIVKNHFYGCLWIICNELGLSTKNFNNKISDGREYSPIVKVAREFRQYFPLLLREYDLKSAFASFVDMFLGTDLKDKVYLNVMMEFNCDRNGAKILFNSMLNKGKYKSLEELETFFRRVGYGESSIELATMVEDPIHLFWREMQLQEQYAIENFLVSNKIKRGSRLHDAIFFIDDKFINQKIKNQFTNYNFESKKINEVENPDFVNLDFGFKKVLDRKTYRTSIPFDFYEKNGGVSKEFINRGESNIFNDFRIYKNDFSVISCSFNIMNDRINDLQFIEKLRLSFLSCKALNFDVNYRALFDVILNNVLENGLYIFNRKYIDQLIEVWNLEHLEDESVYNSLIKYRNFEYIGDDVFLNFEFVTELKKAQLLSKTYYKLIEINEFIESNKKEFLTFQSLGLKKKGENIFITKLIDEINYYNVNCTNYRTFQAKKIEMSNSIIVLNRVGFLDCENYTDLKKEIKNIIKNPYLLEIKDKDPKLKIRNQIFVNLLLKAKDSFESTKEILRISPGDAFGITIEEIAKGKIFSIPPCFINDNNISNVRNWIINIKDNSPLTIDKQQLSHNPNEVISWFMFNNNFRDNLRDLIFYKQEILQRQESDFEKLRMSNLGLKKYQVKYKDFNDNELDDVDECILKSSLESISKFILTMVKEEYKCKKSSQEFKREFYNYRAKVRIAV